MKKSNPIFDAHFHIIDPQFPLIENQGFLPKPFTVEDYSKWMQKLGIEGGVIVSASFQGFDCSYMIDALKRLGSQFVGVIQVPAEIKDHEILDLHQKGVRAVRFNVKRGGSATIDKLPSLSQKIYDLVGWHVELYIDSKDLTPLMPVLLKLPAVSIDHLGLSKEGFDSLLKLAKHGAKIKATGFGRVDFDVLEALKKINQENPEALLFGTDLPSTRAPRPFSPKDIDLITHNFPQETAEKILWKNGMQFYNLKNE